MDAESLKDPSHLKMILNKSPGDGEYCIKVNCSMPRTRKRKTMSDASRPVGIIRFGPQYRASGVLLPITSLPSPYGIWDVGPGRIRDGGPLQAAGQGWWQTLQ